MTKVTVELMADVYNRLYEMDVISLRISEVYGPGSRMPTALRDMLIAVVRGEPFRMQDGADHRIGSDGLAPRGADIGWTAMTVR